jgi:hypothetical protein
LFDQEPEPYSEKNVGTGTVLNFSGSATLDRRTRKEEKLKETARKGKI